MSIAGAHLPHRGRVIRYVCAAVFLLLPFCGEPAFAQRASENAVTKAEDAFGGTVGNENTGIYTEQDVRGFSPQKAGNVRIEGSYFDQVTLLSFRLRSGSSIRVGPAALNYPFPAPTGIVDFRLRNSGNAQVLSLTAATMPYNGYFFEADLQQPIIKDHLSIAAGVGLGDINQADASGSSSYAYSFRPTLKLSRIEIAPFFSGSRIYDNSPMLLFSSSGSFAPAMIDGEKYLGQDWTRSVNDNYNYGIQARTDILEDVSLRASWFRSETVRESNYSEIYAYTAATGLPNHTVISDPNHRIYSDSWEAMLAWSPTVHGWRNRILIGTRGRSRYTESGGSSVLSLGPQALGTRVAEPISIFGAVNDNTVDQSSFSAGYLLDRLNRFQLNVGVQKAKYEAVSRRGVARTSTSADPWLYNASISYSPWKKVQFFTGYVRGLEDSGTAPETAANRNEQLDASSTEQWDAGLHVEIGPMHFITSVFQIRKPYFSFDAFNRYVEVGNVRHSGAELSLSGKVTERLQLVAGAVFIDAKVKSAGTLLAIGSDPIGVPSTKIRIDASYRTGILNGLTFTSSLTYVSERAGSANTFAALNNNQVMLPSNIKLDLGVRAPFSFNGVNASMRLLVGNVTDEHDWKPIASGLYQLNDRRRFTMMLIADL